MCYENIQKKQQCAYCCDAVVYFLFCVYEIPSLTTPLGECAEFARCLSILMHRSLSALLGQELKGSAVLDLYQE